MPIRQTVFRDNSPHLPHLIRLRVAAVSLKVDSFINARFAEQMVTAPDTNLKSQIRQHVAQLLKSNARVGGATQDPFEGPFRTHGVIVPRYFRCLEDQ
jgi:hypothetical protein